MRQRVDLGKRNELGLVACCAFLTTPVMSSRDETRQVNHVAQ
jgi:hypothetical protein